MWFFKYWPKVFQSRRFCDSYRLMVAVDRDDNKKQVYQTADKEAKYIDGKVQANSELQKLGEKLDGQNGFGGAAPRRSRSARGRHRRRLLQRVHQRQAGRGAAGIGRRRKADALVERLPRASKA